MLKKHNNKPLLHRNSHVSVEPTSSPGHDTIPVKNRSDAETATGSTARLSWGVRSDVGLVRSHNEDSFLVRAPLFAVCDGMGGHAAGEVASSIAVQTLADQAPLEADDVLLGAAVEAANAAVIQGAAEGKGKIGMGSTCTCLLIEDDRMAIAHVGDSRLYLLHHGTLVRLTHDHSYVEELVDAGEITADEARVHPSRSVITRALGSDPDMYADHFTLNIATEDRLILCSDGLSSMVEDSEIEAIAVSSTTPQAAADNLVATALSAGGHDNVTVIVVDVIDDGLEEQRRKKRRRTILYVTTVALVIIAALVGLLAAYVQSSWYIANHNGTVGIYHGVNHTVFGLNLSQLDTTTTVETSDLPQTVQDDLDRGIMMSSEDDAHKTIESYRAQIDQEKTDAAETAGKSTEGTDTSPDNPATPEGNSTSSSISGDE
jgi:serine/threonine protein phosphatase PrpC